MGHIGNEFLSGIIQYLHSSKHLIKSVTNMLCLDIFCYMDLFIRKSVLYLIDRFCYLFKWFQYISAQEKGNAKHQYHYQNLYNICPALKILIAGNN